jgi:hypothetical protein
MVGKAAMAIVAYEVVERPFVLVKRDGPGVAHSGVEVGAVGWVLRRGLFRVLLV